MAESLDIDSPFKLQPFQIEFFKQNGFVKIDNVFDPSTLEFFRLEISKKVQELNTLTKPMADRTLYEKAFLQIMNLWRQSEIVKTFVMGKRLAQIATELMGCRGVRLYHDQALYKEPGGGITPWHADQYYWPVDTNNTVTAWVPLQETPLEMGPLAFSPGSFKIQANRNIEISEESEIRIQRTLKDFPIEESAFRLGQVSFHSGWTFHRAGPNKTNRPREVMTIIYIDKEAKLARPKNKNQEKDWLDWCPGVQIGQNINSFLNPIVYSE